MKPNKYAKLLADTLALLAENEFNKTYGKLWASDNPLNQDFQLMRPIK